MHTYGNAQGSYPRISTKYLQTISNKKNQTKPNQKIRKVEEILV